VSDRDLLNQQLNQKWKQLQRETNSIGQAHYNLDHSFEVKISFKLDKSVSIGAFIPNKENPNEYKAHPQTLRALKKDLFVADNKCELFSKIIRCHSCNTEIDTQFWIHCPFCETSFNS